MHLWLLQLLLLSGGCWWFVDGLLQVGGCWLLVCLFLVAVVVVVVVVVVDVVAVAAAAIVFVVCSWMVSRRSSHPQTPMYEILIQGSTAQ